MAGIELLSSTFNDHETLPDYCARDFGNVSPALSWSRVPVGTGELVLVCSDPDAPGGEFLHCLLTGIDPDTAGVAEGALDEVGEPWPNDFGATGWGGPQPPPGDGSHRYVFRVSAVQDPLALPDRPGIDDINAALADHTLADGTLTGMFGR